MRQYQVIILTAGYGKRMRPLTYTTHKTLLKIGDKTVIQRMIDALLQLNLTDINIVTGYQETEIKHYLKQTYPNLKINYIHNQRYAETNNIYSLALALQKISISQDIILIESDLIFDSSVLERLLKSPHGNIALVDRYSSGMDGTVVTVDPEKEIIINIIPPHLQGSNFDFKDKYKTLNIYKFEQDFCQSILQPILVYYTQNFESNSYYELILGILIYLRRVEIFAEILQGEKWAEIDDPNDLKVAQFIFDKSSQKKILDSSFGGYWNYGILDYCFLRNMYFPDSSILSDLKNNLANLLHNYGSTQAIVNQKMANHLLCHENRVITLNGASQIYPLLSEYLIGKQVLIPTPSFGEYQRIFPQAITYSDQVGIDTQEIIEKSKNCEVIVIVNPNNPTGTILKTNWIYNFALINPDKLLIIDESFIEFSSETSILNQLEINPLPNVILIKSLSKVLGVPGLRLGYTYSSKPEIINWINQKIPIWNLNSLAEYFLEIILKYRDEISESFTKTMDDRTRFSAQLKTLPFVDKVYPSGGNFILVSLNCDPNFKENLIQSLLSVHNIYVKDISSKFTDEKNYLRLAVRNTTDNDKFINCLRELNSSF